MSNLAKRTKKCCSKNILTSLVIPAVLVVLAVVLGIVIGFNKGFDFKGGVLVSINSASYNLEDEQEYSTYKNKVDSILSENAVNGSIYLVEKDSKSLDDVLVVKINFDGTQEQTIALVEALKSDLIEEFYSSVSIDEINRNNLVVVSSYGASVDVWNIVSTLLASLVALLLICVYIGFRSDIHTSMLAILSAFISNILAFALIIVTRVQINQITLSIIPMVTILSALLTFVFVKKAKTILKTTNSFDRKSNYILADEAVAQLKNGLCKIFVAAIITLLILSLLNFANPVMYYSLSIIEATIATLYASMFIIPSLFGLTYVRKVKREKVKKGKEQNKLEEQEVLKETNLDELVSN